MIPASGNVGKCGVIGWVRWGGWQVWQEGPQLVRSFAPKRDRLHSLGCPTPTEK